MQLRLYFITVLNANKYKQNKQLFVFCIITAAAYIYVTDYNVKTTSKIYTTVTLGGKPFIFTKYFSVGFSCISQQIKAIHINRVMISQF